MLEELVRQHKRLSDDLAVALRELGDTRAMYITGQATAWDQTRDFAITERRELVRHNNASFAAEIEAQLGEIEALRAEINTIEWQMRVMVGHAGS